jgi:Tetratricopeptide repeat/Anaphase-promoting complex subunit 5
LRRPGWWAWAAAAGIAIVLGAAGFWIGLWVDGALGAGVGVAAGVVAPMLVELIRNRVESREAAARVEPATRRLGPASLLDPALGVVPFTGRQKEMDALLAWCRNDSAGPVRLVTGGGGAGKTRLALELGLHLRKAGGWRCADIDAGTEPDALGAERAAARGNRLLLVADYADARAGLEDLLDAVAREPDRVRLLLLARHAGEWWHRLEGGRQATRHLVADATREVIELADVIKPGTTAADVVLSALPWFAARLNVSVGDIGLVRVVGAERARILDLHAAALVAALQVHNQQKVASVVIDVNAVMDVLLGHEKRYWQDSARTLKLFDVAGGLSAGQLSQAIAAMCLLGAASEAEAVDLSGRVPGAAPSILVASWLRGIYPPDNQSLWLGSLRPDRLAEMQATGELAASPSLTQNCLMNLTERQAQQALVLLARASDDHPQAKPLLEAALFSFPDAAAGIAAPRETLIAVANSIPYPSVVLSGADARLSSKIAATYPSGTSDRASWQETSSNLLAALGRREEALAAIDETVAIRRNLVTDGPNAFQPALAAALVNQAGRLVDLGRFEEALSVSEEAIVIYRQVASTQPDASTSNLAAALNNQSTILSSLGRREESLTAAKEAVAIRRELTTVWPKRFRPELVAALNNQAIRLADLHRLEAALPVIEEAVAICRELASAQPDAYNPNLAAMLTNQSVFLSSIGQRKEALALVDEATAIYRKLAVARPEAFQPDLALSLNNLAGRLAELGRREEALAAIEESVAIRREQAATRPTIFGPDLAASLDKLAGRLADLGQLDQALTAIKEATAIYRGLTVTRPEAFLPNLAGSLNNLAGRLAELGRREEALAAIEEAVTIRREQAAARPAVFRADLALSLSNQSVHLSALGRREEALLAIEESLDIYRELASVRPDAYRANLAAALSNQSGRLAELNRSENALAAIEEAIAICRELSSALPDKFRPNLAVFLHNQSACLSDLERPEDALMAIEEAVAIYRELAAARPAVFGRELGSSLRMMANRLYRLGRQAEAQAASQESEYLTYRS